MGNFPLFYKEAEGKKILLGNPGFIMIQDLSKIERNLTPILILLRRRYFNGFTMNSENEKPPVNLKVFSICEVVVLRFPLIIHQIRISSLLFWSAPE